MTNFRDQCPAPPQDQSLQQAVTHHKTGQLQDAERLYRAILQTQPNLPDANHNLGILAMQMKQPAAGLPHFKVALEANPNQGQYWFSYIDALIQTGQMDVARKVLAEGRQRGLHGEAVNALAERLDGPSSDEINTLVALQVPKLPKSDAAQSIAEPTSKEIEHLVTLFNLCRYPEAETLALEITEHFPKHGFGWKVLGMVFRQMGRCAEALSSLQKATLLSPNDAEAHNSLGNILKDFGHREGAEESYRRAIEIKPDFAVGHSNLGIALHELGRLEEAEVSCRRALKIKPDYAEGHYNLGNTLHELSRLEEAEVSYRRALEIKPDYAEAYSNLAVTLYDLGCREEAEVSCRRAVEIKPDFAVGHSNLGYILKNLGRLEEAEASCRRALEIKPDFAEGRSNLLLTLNYTASRHPLYLREEAYRYGQIVAGKVSARFSAWECMPKPERLRVGLVSGDLRNHPVGYFLESLLAHVNLSRIELFAYPNNCKVDELTARVKPYFSAWKSLDVMGDEAAARLIHGDGVHLLLDLSGHTANNRLPVFAWKPAPVQATWLGYLATSGVAAIDYLIADPLTLPETEEIYFTEKIWRLPETRLCFTPPDLSVEVAPLPALSNGYITFGCFNNLTKMNDVVVALWGRVLKAVPDSCLFLKARQLKEASVRQSIVERFAAQGVDAARLILEGFSPRAEYLAAYQRVDIALDPFPFPGGTTSVESLWMGVPVLTLVGDRFLSRQGIGLLMNAGLPEWVAADADDYVARAVSHAGNLQCLAALRNGLRQQVLTSPIFDAPRFARNFEAALWGMWAEKNK